MFRFIGMRFGLVLGLFLGSLGTCGHASQTMSPDKMKEDLDTLWANLIQIHPEGEAIKDRLRPLYLQQRDELDHAQDFFALATVLAHLLSEVREGHTSLSFPILDPQAVFIPIDVIFSGERVILKRAYSRQLKAYEGQPLVALNGVPTQKIIDQFCAQLPGELPCFKLRGLESDMFKVLFYFNFPHVREAKITLNTDGTQSQSQSVTFLSRTAIKSQRSDESQGVQFHIEKGIATMTIPSFEEPGLKDFFKKSFKRLAHQAGLKLIIDLRDNQGGGLDNVEHLLSHLISAPIHPIKGVRVRASRSFKAHAKDSIPKAFRWLPLEKLDKRGREIWGAEDGALVTLPEEKGVQPSKKPFKGEVYVLTNGLTYSAASLCAYFIQHDQLGTIVGEETGGLEGYSFGNPLHITLPHSGLGINIPSLLILTEDMNKSDHGVLPNLVLSRDVGLELQGVDSQMAKLLGLLNAE